MSRRPAVATTLARLLPVRGREAVLGDLAEDGLRPGSLAHLGALAAIVFRWHVDPWRDGGARLGALLTAAAAWGLHWAVLSAAWSDPEGALELFRDPLSRGAILAWSASHLTAAVGAGILVGHAPWIPPFAVTLRWQVALALAVAAAWAGPGEPAILPPLRLLVATWLGYRGRLEGSAPTASPG
jgi:hypothetical protein